MNLLAIDPGETVGWSIWDTETKEKLAGGQTSRTPFVDALAARHAEGEMIFEGVRVDHIVCEDWTIYPGEAKRGALDFDKCLTARTIGAIQMLARLAGVPVSFQDAKIKPEAKAMGAENYFVTPLHPNRHENDSIMHAVRFMIRRELDERA